MAEQPKRVLFKYHFAEDYNPKYANGAWGGMTTQGEICVNFYMERQPLPTSELFSIATTGNLGELVEREPKDDADGVALRYVQCGVILNLATAKAVVAFLERHIKQAETAGAQLGAFGGHD